MFRKITFAVAICFVTFLAVAPASAQTPTPLSCTLTGTGNTFTATAFGGDTPLPRYGYYFYAPGGVMTTKDSDVVEVAYANSGQFVVAVATIGFQEQKLCGIVQVDRDLYGRPLRPSVDRVPGPTRAEPADVQFARITGRVLPTSLEQVQLLSTAQDARLALGVPPSASGRRVEISSFQAEAVLTVLMAQRNHKEGSATLEWVAAWENPDAATPLVYELPDNGRVPTLWVVVSYYKDGTIASSAGSPWPQAEWLKIVGTMRSAGQPAQIYLNSAASEVNTVFFDGLLTQPVPQTSSLRRATNSDMILLNPEEVYKPGQVTVCTKATFGTLAKCATGWVN